jgi:hypothetical protein
MNKQKQSPGHEMFELNIRRLYVVLHVYNTRYTCLGAEPWLDQSIVQCRKLKR